MHQQPPPHPQPPTQPHPIVYPFGNKAKNQSLNFSDDDEPNNSADDGKRSNNNSSNKTCPWQRMKWTDNMVRLLIMVVYYIGDEVGSEGNTNNDPSGKKKSGGGSGGVLQKKGKWKSVSRAMMERGFYVSPQQCEDKFNDLNKRYKRVNDILGKGTACRVVENQSLLETMDHLSTKMKEEVKKLLNSKHLFFREMCAYHNSCGHNSNGGSASGSGGPIVEELANVSPLEKRQWLKAKMMQLEEQHIGYLCQSFELQKQRLKWEKFTGKKEREMEREKLINERKKLENERMVFLLKQKELELLDFHQQQPNINNRNSDPSSVTG
ncbi:hypothetical protein RND71_031186 [Anisodus tanguticus]|uniref:Myb/SANT-like DNA-binding domain-containing protein n=1 Tax=Anisodus tanguticus TaxID=243964 RepID=A0AAE1V2Y1_9SOLA|nr:hypothetical protein RND71_031186 [Anisodus tanguticus]